MSSPKFPGSLKKAESKGNSPFLPLFVRFAYTHTHTYKHTHRRPVLCVMCSNTVCCLLPDMRIADMNDYPPESIRTRDASAQIVRPIRWWCPAPPGPRVFDLFITNRSVGKLKYLKLRPYAPWRTADTRFFHLARTVINKCPKQPGEFTYR